MRFEICLALVALSFCMFRKILFALGASALIRLGVRFCTWRGRVRIIKRPGDSDPYMIRYALCGWLPGDGERPKWLPNIYLHNIRLPDADPALHNHPWPWAYSLILHGGYQEQRGNGSGWHYTRIRAGQFNTLKKPRDFHRIADVYEYRFLSGETVRGEGCWTLFVTSPQHSQWGFSVPGQGYVPHQIRNPEPPVTLRSRIGQAQTEALRDLNRRQRLDANERTIPT